MENKINLKTKYGYQRLWSVSKMITEVLEDMLPQYRFEYSLETPVDDSSKDYICIEVSNLNKSIFLTVDSDESVELEMERMGIHKDDITTIFRIISKCMMSLIYSNVR